MSELDHDEIHSNSTSLDMSQLDHDEIQGLLDLRGFDLRGFDLRGFLKGSYSSIFAVLLLKLRGF